MKRSFEKQYHESEKKHFWFKSRRNYIIELLKNSPKNSKILDIGCSSGILLSELVEIGFDITNLYGIDISNYAIDNCKKNGLYNVFVMNAQNISIDNTFDFIIASDFVPAFNMLWSEHDIVNMHFKRYTKKELVKILKDNSFEIVKSSYWNFLLFVPVFLLRAANKLYTFKNKKNKGDLIEPKLFNNLLLTIINIENKMLKYINFPFGISTFCIAKRPLKLL